MIEDRETIQNRMLSNIIGNYDKTKGSFIYDAIKPVAIELENISQEIGIAKDNLCIENLMGDDLGQRVIEKTGIMRKSATQASGYVVVTGTAGAVMSEGNLVASDTLSFIVKETKAIDDTGKAEVLVECEEYGSVGNVPTGAIQYFPITITGIKSVINNADFTNGYDAESDAELLERYYEHIRTPAISGNKYHYINWAKEVTGVGDVKVIPLWNGDNTIKIVIIDSNKQPGSSELVAEVQDYIDPNGTGLGEGQAPIGAYCTVVSANSIDINISFTAIKDDSVTDEERVQNVKENITNYLKEIAFNEKVISYNRIVSIILDSKGVVDFSNLTINDQTTALSLEEEDVAVLGVVTIA